MLYASEGREAEARLALTELVRELDTPEAYFAASQTYEILGDPQAAAALQAEAKRLFPDGEGAQGTRARLDERLRSGRLLPQVPPRHLRRRVQSLEPEQRGRDVRQRSPRREAPVPGRRR